MVVTTLTKLRGGRRRKRQAGGFAGGHAPYGFRVEGKGREERLVPDSEEQRVVRYARQLRGRGWPLRRIGERLGERGFTNRAGSTSWNPKSVRAVIGEA